jgi:hypothetical protein
MAEINGQSSKDFRFTYWEKLGDIVDLVTDDNPA